MELRILRYFLAVVREGNITKAAEILHITQPTLSRQLKELEEELGTNLFIRGKREIKLTDEGLLLDQRAKEIIELADKTERQFMEHKNLIGGVISIGCVESRATLFLPELLEKFSIKYPQVQYDLYNGYADDIKEKIDKGLIDIGLLLEPVEISKYDFIRLPHKERWGVLMQKSDPLAQKESITLKDISMFPLIIPKRAIVQNEIANWFDGDFEKIHIFATYNLLFNAILLVEKGLGYAVCLQGALSVRDNSTTCFVPFTPERNTKSVLIWKKNYIFSSASSLFIQTAKILFKQINNRV